MHHEKLKALMKRRKYKFMLKSYKIYVLYKTLSFMTMKVIIFYEKKFMKKNFVIL